MIVTYGTPFTFRNYSILSLSWDKCLDHCLKTDNCMVVYSNTSANYCQFFKIGDLKIANRSNNKDLRIGFKIRDRFNLTECPVDDTVGGEGYSFDNYTHRFDRYYNGYSFTYDKKSASWNFNSTGRLGCPLFPQGLFMRPAGLWCIIVAQHILKLREVIVQARLLLHRNVLCTKGFTITAGMGSIWIGGTRKKSCSGKTKCKGLEAFEFVDPTLSKNPTGYLWHPGKPTGENCLALTKRNDGTVGIEDVSCTKNTVSGVPDCLSSYACGYSPVLM